jgi:hypothetical protein
MNKSTVRFNNAMALYNVYQLFHMKPVILKPFNKGCSNAPSPPFPMSLSFVVNSLTILGIDSFPALMDSVQIKSDILERKL